ncbi:MAG: hypothetical protein LBC68_09770 [Prevotellaceae bacterium]|jgi:hypothetical protein|nr:hypothetical protein [Prevotellaceae bacterium]
MNNYIYEMIELCLRDQYNLLGTINTKIDFQDLNAGKLLKVISDESKKWYLEEPKELRALRKLSKIATKARIESGYLLTSMFLNIFIERDNISTEVIDGKEHDDFIRNPYDFDYAISPDDIESILNVSEPEWKICAVTTHDASQPPVCSECNGKGFFRCEKCEGSGREQYVDGYYANGEERIKTGQCSDCYGTGKIQCDECAGSGKYQIFSKQYQTVKKFEDNKIIMSYIAQSDTFYRGVNRGYLFDSRFIKDDDELENREMETEIKWWYNLFDNQELKEGIDELHKNQKEVIIDKNQTLPNGISKKCKDLYEKNKMAALNYFEDKEEGKLGCAVEKHFAIPLFRIYFSTKIDDREYHIEIYENNENGMQVCIPSMPDLSFFRSLFI